MNRRAALELGGQARMVLDNPAVAHALRALEEKYVQAWMTSAPADEASREDAYRALRALQALTDELTILLDNGEIAAQQIDREERRNG